MSNPNKAKGTAWETAIVRALRAFFGGRHGLAPRRVAQSGALDTGDVHGVSPLVLQAKNTRAHDLSGWLDGPHGVTRQAARSGEPAGVVVVKRPRRPVGDAYAVLRLADLARLLLRLRSAEARLREHAPTAYAEHAAECDHDRATEFPT